MSEDEIVHDVAFVDDDDDMPPLVDNPYPASMTFTFAANMTPIAYGTDQNALEVPPEVMAPRSFIYSPPPDPELEPTTTSHSKKKDASYIPRPPNAFILFRSHFIKAQHIPEKIEGNHSALSKIIGKYWKTLPREERQVWETKAIMALADHRKKYPDWRFRPSSNALAKVKDGPKRRNNKKARGEAEKKVKNREKRCDKIADLLVAGKTGVDLEQAIEKFDHENQDAFKLEDGGCGVFSMKTQEPVSPSSAGDAGVEKHIVKDVRPPSDTHAQGCSVSLPVSRDMTPHTYDARFCTPLTSMFRRSSSAPAAHTRVPLGETHCLPYLGRRESFSAAYSTEAVRTASAPPYGLAHEFVARVEHKAEAMFNVGNTRAGGYLQTSLQPSSLTVLSSPDISSSSWDDTSTSTSFGTQTHSPALPALGHDVDDYSSPVHSPQSSAFDMFSEADAASVYSERAMDFPDAQYSVGFSQYSSLKTWAGDGETKGVPADTYIYATPFVVTPQTPSMYDPEGIMQDAFEAASYAHFGGWDLGLNQAQLPLWRDSTSVESLQDYARGLEDIGCRQGDNLQLFTYPPTAN